MSLPLHERPKQRPMLKKEESGNVILASYPESKALLPPPSIMPTSSNQTYESLTDPMIKLAHVVPILNGRDSDGNSKYLGPERTKIHRYLLLLWVAKSTEVFRLYGKEVDNSIYFTLYNLGKVADSFKQFGPYLPIHYDRTKTAIRIYTTMSNSGLVDIKKIDGDTYVTTTAKGDDVSAKSLQNLIAYGELTNKDGKQGWLKNLVDKFTRTLDDRRTI
jgi:hypothetical protein